MSMAIVLLVAVLLVGTAAVLFLRASEREREEDINLRLRVLGNSQDEAAVALAGIKANRDVENPILRWFCHLVWRTGVEMEAGAVLRVLIGIAIFIPIALLLVGPLRGFAVLALLLLVGWFVLVQRGASRRRKIMEQLPSFLESAIRVLAAGNTLEESLAAASREAPEPIKPLFTSVGRQVRLGAPVEAVLMQMADIHKIPDLKIMALAASINRKFGGSMRNVFRSLIAAVRQRENAARELRALTAETRFSALVLAIIPVLLMAYIIWMNPGYYTQMWEETTGRAMLVGSVAMQVVGMLVIYRMMKSTG